jgi:hypothetical protein
VTEDSDPRDRALIEYLEWRERHKIWVSGDIYRLPGTKGYQSETWDITWWTVEGLGYRIVCDFTVCGAEP